MTTPTCKTCRFFARRGGHPGGECRRYPQELARDEYHWCGEWREVPRVAVDENGQPVTVITRALAPQSI